ncbi:hypothetical protein [[Pantoea] beijingensis]|uniref:hypothetical protein n=1 Tax=[Pantoea] beijingensis TaxID=1324864 RepID=UPI000FE3CBD3|nr:MULTISPECIES: hypothetical protein [Erwiniaceae]
MKNKTSVPVLISLLLSPVVIDAVKAGAEPQTDELSTMSLNVMKPCAGLSGLARILIMQKQESTELVAAMPQRG